VQPELSSLAPAARGTAGILTHSLRKLFSFPVMMACGLAVIAVLTVSGRFDDPDLWFHLKLGQVVWTTHSIPSTEPYSFTAPNHPWTAYEWLAELGIYAVYRAGGDSGLMMCFAGLASLLFILVYLLCYQHSKSWLVAFLGAVCAWFFGTVGLAIRPQLLGYGLLAAEMLLLELASRDRRWLWLLPPLFAVWVNCHGSFFFGMGVLGVYWLSSRVTGRWGMITAEAQDRGLQRALGIAVALCTLALFVNPIGLRLVLYPLDLAFHQSTNLNAVQEWLPPDLRSGRALGMLAAVLGIFIAAGFRRLEVPLRSLLVLAAAFALSLQHSRMLIIFGIAAAPVLCRVLAPLLGHDRKRDVPLANALFLCGFAVAVAWNFPSHAQLQKQVAAQSPVDAVAYVRKAGLTGPMLNEYVFGHYLLWALPEQKVFIDGNADIFDKTGVLMAYGRWATLQEDPQILLNNYHIRFCLLAKDAPMTYVLPYLPGWRQVYADKVAQIFVR
jgi:hypothetical protein